MPPRSNREPLYLGISLFESGKIYEPASMAKRIANMDREPDGTLKTIVLPGRYDPKNTTTLTGPIMGIGHYESFDGANQVTVVRSNQTLYRHQGWDRTFHTLASSLTYDPGQPFPDVCLPINGKIVWSNGIDRPRVIDCSKEYGRLCTPLGFATAPAAPLALGPTPGAYDASIGGWASGYGVGAGVVAPNMSGYSVPGNIGTTAVYQGEDGSLLGSAYLYKVQWESFTGDRGPLSNQSNVVTVQEQSTGYLAPASGSYVRKNKLDMMRRGFCVRGMDIGEDHVKAILVYRTTDTLHTDGKYRLVSRIEGRQSFAYPDSMSDADLVNSDIPDEPVEVQPFKLACEYQGRLVTANYQGQPGLVRWSQQGYIGTFLKNDWIVPDAGGAQITGLVAYAGSVYLFTELSIFRLDLTAQGPQLKPVNPTCGCAAPGSIQAIPDGRLVFLSRLGIYALSPDGTVQEIGQEIYDIVSTLNMGKAGRAVAGVDPQTGIYVLAMPTKSQWNDTIVGFDWRVGGWRSYDMSPFSPVQFHAAAGRAGHLLMGAFSNTGHTLRVWNRPDASENFSISSEYETNEIRIDPQGLKVFRVKAILVGFIESDAKTDDPSLNVRVWTTSRKTGETPTTSYYDTTAELVGQDFGDAWTLGELTLNSLTPNTGAYYRTPMVTWRKIEVDRSGLTGLRFKLSTVLNRRLHLHGIAIIAEEQGNEASRIPGQKRSV